MLCVQKSSLFFLMGDCFLASDAAAPLWRFCQGRLRSSLRFSFRQHTFCEPSVVVDFASPLGIPASPQKACPRPLFAAGHSPQQCKQGLGLQAMCGRLLRHRPSKQILCQVPCHLLAHNRYATRRAAKLRPNHLLWYQ